MNEIINALLKIIEENNMSIYHLAKLTNINYSLLHKILHFDRKLKPDYFYKILENLPISVIEKNSLLDKYNRIFLGSDNYSMVNSINEILRQFSSISITINNKLNLPPPDNSMNAYDKVTICTGNELQYIINIALIEEMNKQIPKVYIYTPGNKKKIYLYIDNIVKLYKTDIKIRFMIDFLSNTVKTADNNNLKILNNIIPCALSDTPNYEFYYTYKDCVTNDSLTPYPYFIALSDSVICINSTLDEALFINDKATAKRYSSKCEGILKNYNKLIETSFDVFQAASNMTAGDYNATERICLEYEPCLFNFLTPEIINSLLVKDIPERDILLNIVYNEFSKFSNIKKTTYLFNKESLIEFAATGFTNLCPRKFTRAATPEERKFVLDRLLIAIDSDNNIIRALNPINFNVPVCRTVNLLDDYEMHFVIYFGDYENYKCIFLKEKSLIKCFYNFLSNLSSTNMVYSKEETKSFIEEAIASIE